MTELIQFPSLGLLVVWIEACPNTHTHTPGRTSVFELTAALLYHISATLRALCPLTAEPRSCRQTPIILQASTVRQNGTNLTFIYFKNNKKTQIYLFIFMMSV